MHVRDAAGARRHDVDGLGQEHRLAEVVGHQHAGERALAAERLVQLPHLLAGERVEGGERLVEQQAAPARGSARGRGSRAGASRPRARAAAGAPAPSRPDRPAGAPRARSRQRGARRRARIAVLARGSRAAAADCRARCATEAGPGSGRPCRRSSTGPPTARPSTATWPPWSVSRPGDQLEQGGLAAAARPDERHRRCRARISSDTTSSAWTVRPSRVTYAKPASRSDTAISAGAEAVPRTSGMLGGRELIELPLGRRRQVARPVNTSATVGLRPELERRRRPARSRAASAPGRCRAGRCAGPRR